MYIPWNNSVLISSIPTSNTHHAFGDSQFCGILCEMGMEMGIVVGGDFKATATPTSVIEYRPLEVGVAARSNNKSYVKICNKFAK